MNKKQNSVAVKGKNLAAVLLGQMGGRAVAKKYSTAHFRKIAAMRKVFAGGRPRKIEK
jgi:hypothetical protein